MKNAAWILSGFLIFSVSTAHAAKHIVLFKQQELMVGNLSHEEFQNLLQASNGKSVGQLKEWLKARGYTRPEVKDLWLVRGAVVDVDSETAKKLHKEPWVGWVREDRVRKFIHPMPNLTVAGSLKDLGDDMWGLKRTGLDKVRAEFPQIDGSNVRVGILDTGIQSKHPELAGKLSQFKDFTNGLTNPYDDQGHGTHVAGTISGNQVGFATGAKLICGKVFAANGSANDASLLEAMQWAFDPDGNSNTPDYPHLVSNSWGGDINEGVNDIDEFLPFQLAIAAWIGGGVIPVFAAGNSGRVPNGFPGGLPEAISVGALAPEDTIAEFSSRGPNLWKIGPSVLTLLKPDISAPGVKINSAFPGNKFASQDGTSMATPHVSGAIALLLNANPKLKFADVKKLLLETSEKKIDTNYGYGILNAYELVKAGLARR